MILLAFGVSCVALLVALYAAWQAREAVRLRQRSIFLDNPDNELCIRISAQTRQALINGENIKMQRITHQ